MSLLRPGLHAVRRDDHHLQVGLDPPWRVIVPDDPDVRRVLADLDAGRAPSPESPAGRAALHDLQTTGMLHPGTEASAPAGQVLVTGPPDSVAEARRLLGGASVATTTTKVADADLALVLAAGEPPREAVDDHVRAGRPHLVVAAGAAGYRLGPFVLPGATACLRCVDAHLGEHDPRRAVVVEQLSGLPAAPDDPLLAVLALTWAIRDVVRHLAGETPTTWSATVDLGGEFGARRRAWDRHPYCGCSWSQAATG